MSNLPLPSIFIIDDNELDCELMALYLKKSNLIESEKNIIISQNGEEALGILTNQEQSSQKYGNLFPPSLTFLDINMPRMDGFQFLEKYLILRKEDKVPELKIFMLTSSVSPQDKQRASIYKFILDFITKPLSKTLIEEKILPHLL